MGIKGVGFQQFRAHSRAVTAGPTAPVSSWTSDSYWIGPEAAAAESTHETQFTFGYGGVLLFPLALSSVEKMMNCTALHYMATKSRQHTTVCERPKGGPGPPISSACGQSPIMKV